MKYIILNFSSGFGPFLRTTELAVAVNNLLAEKLGQRLGIIVPLVYGERQKNIMLEMFGDIINRWPAELVLAEELGDLAHDRRSGRLPLHHCRTRRSVGRRLWQDVWHANAKHGADDGDDDGP